MVSSSSAYVAALKQKSYVRKESDFISLRSKTPDQMKQAVKSIFDVHLKNMKADSSHFEKSIEYIL